MPISVVVGGQFGSEGKGKVALHAARAKNAVIVVRVGGTNSGHTAVDDADVTWSLRQLPVSLLAGATALLPAGAIIDPEILLMEISRLGLPSDRVVVSRYATLISPEDKEAERSSGLISEIGSTGSGTGAALVRRMNRNRGTRLAGDHPELQRFLGDTSALMRSALNQNRWIVIEGSQGFGLSLLHGGHYPKATSRDTTAGTFLGEAGLSPRDTQDITMVLRVHPIRVAGDSGPLPNETTWATIAKEAGLAADFRELTTATRKVRRVGRFDPELVKRAIEINNPSRIVLNHFDYVEPGIRNGQVSTEALKFLDELEQSIGRPIDLIGTGPATLIPRQEFGQSKNHPMPKYSRQGD
jgi:adenylosuccinate synthase